MEQSVNREASMEDNATNWHVPILAMTADVIQATHEKCLGGGMDGYVSKPFEAEQLYREVSRFFQSYWKEKHSADLNKRFIDNGSIAVCTPGHSELGK